MLAIAVLGILVLIARCGEPASDWKLETLEIIEHARAYDGGYGRMPEFGYILSPSRTYYATALMNHLGLAYTECTVSAIDSRLRDAVNPTESDLEWSTLEDSFYLVKTITLIGQTPAPSESRVDSITRAVQDLLLQDLPIATSCLVTAEQVGLCDWLVRVEQATFLDNALRLGHIQPIHTALIQLWNNREFFTSTSLHQLSLICSLLRSMSNVGIDPRSLRGYEERIDWVGAQIRASLERVQEDLSSIYDLSDGLEAIGLLGGEFVIGPEVIAGLSDIQLRDGGYDLVFPVPPLDPAQTLRLLKLFESARIDYPNMDHLLRTVTKLEMPWGGLSEKAILQSNLSDTHAALASYRILGSMPPDRDRLETYLIHELQSLGSRDPIDPYQLWLVIDSLRLVASKAHIQIDITSIEVKDRIMNPADLIDLYYSLRLARLLGASLSAGNRRVIADMIESLQTSDGRFSLGDGTDLRSSYLCIETLHLLGALTDSVKDRTVEWLESYQQEDGGYGDGCSSFEGAFEASCLFASLDRLPPPALLGRLYGMKSPGGGFGQPFNILDIFWGLAAFTRLEVAGSLWSTEGKP